MSARGIVEVSRGETSTVDPREALVERIRTGPLKNSRRLQQLFAYLCDRALRAPEDHVSEDQIGVAVFDRLSGYDTSVDTIVRVQVSQLRRKLEHYFLADGRDEPIVIDLPKGSYLPLFRSRVEEPVVLPSTPAEPTAGVAPRVIEPRSAVRRPWWAVMALLVVLCGALIFENARLRQAAGPATPYLAHFWGQFLENRRTTHVVLSDSSVSLLAEALRKPVTLGEYRRASYPWTLSDSLPADPRMKTLLQNAAIKGFTTSHDARAARDISAICGRYGQTPNVVSARDLQVDPATAENLILLGSRRANPWMEPFEPALNFKYQFDEARRAASVANSSPQAGEAAVYTVDWSRRSYCVVAFVPRPHGTGNALLVLSADFLAAGAGGQLIASEQAMAGLYSRLGVALSGRVPHFEVLLRADLAGNAATNYEVVAHRVF
jgi:hypothetical protein